MEALQNSKELCHCQRRHTKTVMKIEDNDDSYTKLQNWHRTCFKAAKKEPENTSMNRIGCGMKQGLGERKTLLYDRTKQHKGRPNGNPLVFTHGFVKGRIKYIQVTWTTPFVTIAGVHFPTTWYTKSCCSAFIFVPYKSCATRIWGWEIHWLFALEEY